MKILNDKKRLAALAKQIAATHNSYVKHISGLIKEAAEDCYDMTDDDATEVMSEVLGFDPITVEECEKSLRGRLQHEANIVEGNEVEAQIEELKKKLTAINERK